MPIYSKPTKLLMREFATDRLKPGHTFEKKDAVQWFSNRYPDIRPATVQMHVEGMAVNSTLRKHHPSIRPGSDHDLFFKIGPGKFRLWDSKTDPTPVYRDQLLHSSATTEVEAAEIEETEDESLSREFAFERDLRNYLAKNLNAIETGLNLYHEEEFSGLEFPVGGRFVDILAVDGRGAFVVIELKVSRGYDRTIGQILRYMAWVQHNIAEGKPVRGIIIASEVTEDLKLAASLLPNVQLVEYEIAFKLKPIAHRTAPIA